MTKTILKTGIALAISLLLGCQPQPEDTSVQKDNHTLEANASTTQSVDISPDNSQPKPLSPLADSNPADQTPDSTVETNTETSSDHTDDSASVTLPETTSTAENTALDDSHRPVTVVGPPVPESHTAQKPLQQDSPPVQSDKPGSDDTTSADKTADEIHEVFTLADQIFKTYVDKNGNVDYSTLRRRRSQLLNAARAFDELDPAEYLPWSKQQKTAFWINAFNIFTLKTIVDNYPIQPRWYMINYPKNSIIQLQSPWTKLYFDIMDIQYTLREIEREILLTKFKDMRVCFALSYATLGGAFLRNEAYLPDKLDRQLDEQVARYLNDPRGMIIVPGEQAVYLGDIFNWYREEFARQFSQEKKFRQHPQPLQSYLVFISDHVSEKDSTYLQSNEFTVKFQRYDWQLNEHANGK